LPALRPARTAGTPLPGGEFGERSVEDYRLELGGRRPGFAPETLARLVRRYGTRTDHLLGDAQAPADLGEDLGGGLTEREVNYLKEHEWAREPDDVLWRRTKVGLSLAPDERGKTAERVARLL
jgi:glycerol-3-phosphate dehydrogenase